MNVNLYVCVCVCMYVCYPSPPKHAAETQHIIYRWNQNLYEHIFVYILSTSDQTSGRNSLMTS